MNKHNLVIPMAGLGSRFSSVGYSTPKPLLPIGEFKMFEMVIANLATRWVDSIALVAPEQFNLKNECRKISESLGVAVHLVETENLTQGPAISALMGIAELDSSLPVVIANSDQYLDFDASAWLGTALAGPAAGSILCMRDTNPKWSFVRLNDNDEVAEVAEKKVISDIATCGVYFFRSGEEFVAGVNAQVDRDSRVNGEFYVAPVYNELIGSGESVVHFDLGAVSDVMFGLGVPEDYEAFIAQPLLVSKVNEVCTKWLS